MSNTKETRLIGNKYPGRGIVIGATPDNKNLVQVYWIMGRSPNSRNRVFEIEDDSVKTKAFDESKLEDPSLIIYYPVKEVNNYHIVTNGNQTDTIADALFEYKTFEEALKTRQFEPDPPNFTPRISGIIDTDEMTYKLSILKTIDNNELNELKSFYNYSSFIPGIGNCITTYIEDGNPLPSFEGEPFKLQIFDDIDMNVEKFWNYLDEDNKISLLVKYINIKSKEVTMKIKNKYN